MPWRVIVFETDGYAVAPTSTFPPRLCAAAGQEELMGVGVPDESPVTPDLLLLRTVTSSLVTLDLTSFQASVLNVYLR